MVPAHRTTFSYILVVFMFPKTFLELNLPSMLPLQMMFVILLLQQPSVNSDVEERLRRLEADKDSLQLQVTVLTEQIEVQTDKISDLEKLLDEKKRQLSNAEDMLQRASGTFLEYTVKVREKRVWLQPQETVDVQGESNGNLKSEANN